MAEQNEEQRQALLATVARIRPEIEAAAVEGESLMTLPASSVETHGQDLLGMPRLDPLS
jgi:hypothetical protein